MGSRRGGSARGGEDKEWSEGCCSFFVMANNPSSTARQGILGELVAVPWLREAVPLLRGHTEQGEGELVFQA